MALRSGPIPPPAPAMAWQLVQFRSSRRKMSSPALGVPLGGDLGDRRLHLPRGERLDLGIQAGGLAQGVDERRVGPAERVQGAQAPFRGIGGKLGLFDRRGQLVGTALQVHEGGDQRGEVLRRPGLAEHLDGLARGLVGIEPRQRGDGQGANLHRPLGRGQGLDAGPARRAADRRQGVNRRGADRLAGLGGLGDVPQRLAQLLHLPDPRQADRRQAHGWRNRLRVLRLDQPAERGEVSFGCDLAGPRGLGQRLQGIQAARFGKALRFQDLLIEVAQVGRAAALADHLQDRPLPLLRYAAALEQLDQGAIRILRGRGWRHHQAPQQRARQGARRTVQLIEIVLFDVAFMGCPMSRARKPPGVPGPGGVRGCLFSWGSDVTSGPAP